MHAPNDNEKRAMASVNQSQVMTEADIRESIAGLKPSTLERHFPGPIE